MYKLELNKPIVRILFHCYKPATSDIVKNRDCRKNEG